MKNNKKENKLSKKKKIILIVVLSILVLTSLIIRYGFKNIIGNEKIEKITISTSNSKIGIGVNRNIDIQIKPDNAKYENLKWNISNPKVLKIENNKVIGLEIGKSTIYLESNNIRSNELEFDCVTFIEEVEIINPIDKISAFEEYELKLSLFPETAEDKTYKLESLDTSILEIKDNKFLVGKKAGSVKVIIKDGFGKILNHLDLEVIWNKITKLKLDEKNVKIGVDQKYILNTEIEPVNATNKNLIWKSTDESVVEVKENGMLIAKKVGTAKIIVSTLSKEKEDFCDIIVTKEKNEFKKLYVTGVYEIKEKPLYQSETLSLSEPWEAYEVIKEYDNKWVKIRNEYGNPGFMIYRDNRFSYQKPKLVNVKYISNLDIKMQKGSSIASSLMLLSYYGYKTNSNQLYENLKLGMPKKLNDEKNGYISGNPFIEFIGNPNLSEADGSIITYPLQPIKNMINNIYHNLAEIKYITNNKEIYDLIDQNIPILLNINSKGEILKSAGKIKFENMEYEEYINLATGVLIGYDEKYMYIHNPETEKYQKMDKEIFFKNLQMLNNEILILRK